MNAGADQPTVIVRKLPAVWWILLVLALPFVALAMAVPRFRIFGIVLVTLAIIRFARQTLSVRITDKDVVLQTAISRKRYALRRIRHVTLAAASGAFGATTPSVRLDFFDGPPVQISGFLIDETGALYAAVFAAWQRVHQDKQPS
jgi:hypothetical protein